MTTILTWLSAPAFTAFGAPTTWAEVLGFLTGALCVYLVARQTSWNWPIGIANNVLWIVLFLSAGLFADSGLQVVYIALALIGWYQWLRGGPARTLLPVSTTTSRQWMVLAATGLVGTGLGTYLLATYTPSTVPLFDALTTVISLLATWGQVQKKIESWYLWMIADLVYIPLYQYKGLTLTAILYVGFFALCLYGWSDWRKDLRAQAKTQHASEPVMEKV